MIYKTVNYFDVCARGRQRVVSEPVEMNGTTEGREATVAVDMVVAELRRMSAQCDRLQNEMQEMRTQHEGGSRYSRRGSDGLESSFWERERMTNDTSRFIL